MASKCGKQKLNFFPCRFPPSLYHILLFVCFVSAFIRRIFLFLFFIIAQFSVLSTGMFPFKGGILVASRSPLSDIEAKKRVR